MKLSSEFVTRPIAHRGLHDVDAGRLENSLLAFEAAINGGYGIELDLQGSKDGQAMVFHDYELDVLTDKTGLLIEQTAQQLKSATLKGLGGQMPTLPELLDFVDGRVPILIEPKDQDRLMGDNIGPLERATAAALRDYKGPAAVMSYNPYSVAMLADLLPDVPRGYTVASFGEEDWGHLSEDCRIKLGKIGEYEQTESCFVSQQASALASPRIAELKAMGATILCWTIRSRQEELEARKIADNITFEGYLA